MCRYSFSTAVREPDPSVAIFNRRRLEEMDEDWRYFGEEHDKYDEYDGGDEYEYYR